MLRVLIVIVQGTWHLVTNCKIQSHALLISWWGTKKCWNRRILGHFGWAILCLMMYCLYQGYYKPWSVRHLNFNDRCKLKTRATGISFAGKICFCETCIISKMRAMPFQNMGDKSNIKPKQNICYDVSGPFPPTPEGYVHSFNAICKRTGKRWRGAGRFKSESAEFLRGLIARLDNTALLAGRVET